jgi:hypothetical protein
VRVDHPDGSGDERKRRWRWLLMGVVIGAVLMFGTLRVLQEMINEAPEQAAPSLPVYSVPNNSIRRTPGFTPDPVQKLPPDILKDLQELMKEGGPPHPGALPVEKR